MCIAQLIVHLLYMQPSLENRATKRTVRWMASFLLQKKKGGPSHCEHKTGLGNKENKIIRCVTQGYKVCWTVRQQNRPWGIRNFTLKYKKSYWNVNKMFYRIWTKTRSSFPCSMYSRRLSRPRSNGCCGFFGLLGRVPSEHGQEAQKTHNNHCFRLS